jgi:hypothetical protein
VQSERQLRAYVFIHTLEQGSPPPCLPVHEISFRNNVVHRGTIPTRPQAEHYGQEVLDVIVPVLNFLRNKEGQHVQHVIRIRLANMRQGIPPKQQWSTMTRPGTISITRALSEPQPTLLQALSELEDRRGNIRW